LALGTAGCTFAFPQGEDPQPAVPFMGSAFREIPWLGVCAPTSIVPKSSDTLAAGHARRHLRIDIFLRGNLP
jgi:hypothetical protein